MAKRRGSLPDPRHEVTVDEATSAITKDYYADVRGVGDDIIRAIKDGEITDPDSADTYLHETIDGTRRVIYTWQARLGLLASENADAYFDEGLSDLDCSEGIPYEQLMYWAMRADVLEYLDREGVDLQSDETYEQEEHESNGRRRRRR